jgi:hypothetical protein
LCAEELLHTYLGILALVAHDACKVIAMIATTALFFNSPAVELTADEKLNGLHKLLSFGSRK